MKNLTLLSLYNYDLPEELIAKVPLSKRDRSRLMVIDRVSGNITEMVFRDFMDTLNVGDSLVFNDTKVIPARLYGKKSSGAQIEILLTKPLGDDLWEVLAKPGKKLRAGTRVCIAPNFEIEVIESLPDGSKKVQFHYDGDFEKLLNAHGQMPLPHYMQRQAEDYDAERYQTVFAKHPGAVAAPTAGLHFTQKLLDNLSGKGITQTHLTLHVGLGTFQPVTTDDIREHQMHTEIFMIDQSAAQQLNARSDPSKQICVGTTTCRALETAATAEGTIIPGQYETDIFIYPGYRFKYVRSLLTNFHLPGSTLLMLVSAFAGYDLTMEAYRKAVKDKYRFYSYGDAMLILN